MPHTDTDEELIMLPFHVSPFLAAIIECDCIERYRLIPVAQFAGKNKTHGMNEHSERLKLNRNTQWIRLTFAIKSTNHSHN